MANDTSISFFLFQLGLQNEIVNLKVKLDIIKHKRFYNPRLYPGLYLAFCCSQYGCRTNAFRVGRVFVSRIFVIDQCLVLRHMVQLRRFLGLKSKPCLAITKDTASRGLC